MYQHNMFGEPEKVVVKRGRKRKNFTGKSRVGRFLLYGGGLQSTVLLYMSLVGETEPYNAVFFANTGDEPRKVDKFVQAQIKPLLRDHGVPFIETKPQHGTIKVNLLYGVPMGSMPVWVDKGDGSRPGRGDVPGVRRNGRYRCEHWPQGHGRSH